MQGKLLPRIKQLKIPAHGNRLDTGSKYDDTNVHAELAVTRCTKNRCA